MKCVKMHVPINPKRRSGAKATMTTITIHSTANPNSTARNERNWLMNTSNNRTASWHLAVDDKECIEAIPLNEKAWHSGTKLGNDTSIGIEICESGNRAKTIQNAVDVTVALLKERGWGVLRLRKHNDWTGKNCPRIFSANNWRGWNDFKAKVQLGLDGEVDMRVISKNMRGEDVRELQSSLVKLGYDPKGVDGICGVGCFSAIKQFQRDNGLAVDGWYGKDSAKVMSEKLKGVGIARKSKYYKVGDAHIIKTKADNIELEILGDSLRGRRFGINGSFFDTPRPTLPNSAWSIATNNGKPLGGNSMLVSYNRSIKRGTIVRFKDGTMGIYRVNSINEFPKPHDWSISGYSVYPFMNFGAEKMPSGINYRTAHTYLGFKGDTVYLIVKPNHMITQVLPLIKQLGLEGCILLDGGGSSQLNHPDGIYNSNRKINTAVLLKEV